MAFDFRIDRQNRVVLFKAIGTFSSEDLRTCVAAVVADPDFEPDCDHLVDLRRITTFEPSAQDLRARAKRDAANEKLNAGRIAIVSSNDIVYGMTRMYEILMDDASVSVRTFKTMEEAMTWLGLPIDSAAFLAAKG